MLKTEVVGKLKKKHFIGNIIFSNILPFMR